MVEYYEDSLDDDPYAMLDAMRGEDGEIVLSDTGDSLLDKWERELAAGLEPDLEEGLSDLEKEKLRKEREKKSKIKGIVAEAAVINEDFTKPQVDEKMNKQYESKFVAVGSPEDVLLTRAAVLWRQQRREQIPVPLGGGLKRRGR